MSDETPKEKCLILIKALPHAAALGETVCCAGVTENRQWCRQYPVYFRSLDTKFQRWNWIEYEWRKPRDDKRKESRRVQEDTINVVGKMRTKERANFLGPLVLPSTREAAARGMTLTMIRPRNLRFSYRRKSEEQIKKEKRAYETVASQGSFFDQELTALEPCPFTFAYEYNDEENFAHRHECGDWEVSATFFNWRKRYGEEKALSEVERTFGEKLPESGMVFGMGTHSRRPEQWLLVGVIRLDETNQVSLF